MPAPIVIATPGGSAPLARCTVLPLHRFNCSARGFWIDALSGLNVVASSGFRLSIMDTYGGPGSPAALLAIDSAGARTFRAAIRDANGMWSEFTGAQTNVLSNFSGATVEASIGSGSTRDQDLHHIGIEFPDLAAGSGMVHVYRTLVGSTENFWDQTRTSRQTKMRAAFTVVLDNMDVGQQQMLHRFYRALDGPQQPFFFDYYPPEKGTRVTTPAVRYIVRFGDPVLADRLFGVSLHEATFSLVEVIEDPEGGDV